LAYADPQSVTVNAVAQSMPRIASGNNEGAFGSADGAFRLAVSNAYGRRTRRSIRLTQKKISADPFIPERNVESSASVYVVVDHPVNGFTNAELKFLVDGFTAYLTASSGAKVTQLLGGEN